MVSSCPVISKSSSSFYQSFDDCAKSTNYDWYNRHFHAPQFFFDSLVRSCYLPLFSFSFNYTLWSAGTEKSTILQVLFFFFVNYYKVRSRLRDPFVCQNPIGVDASYFLGQMLGCANTLCSYGQIPISCTIPSRSLCPLSVSSLVLFLC